MPSSFGLDEEPQDSKKAGTFAAASLGAAGLGAAGLGAGAGFGAGAAVASVRRFLPTLRTKGLIHGDLWSIYYVGIISICMYVYIYICYMARFFGVYALGMILFRGTGCPVSLGESIYIYGA